RDRAACRAGSRRLLRPTDPIHGARDRHVGVGSGAHPRGGGPRRGLLGGGTRGEHRGAGNHAERPMSAAAMELPNVEEEGLQLGPVPGANDRVRFAGTGEAEGAAVLDRFLTLLHRQVLSLELRRVTIELAELEFINSSCLKAMVAWIYKVDTEGRPYKIHLRRDASMHWQRTSLATLQRLAPEVVVIEET